MEKIQNSTCIKFVYADYLFRDYIVFRKNVKGAGCSSRTGRVGGIQPIHIDTNSNCASPDRFLRTAQHEIIHALGFTHMQNHHARDKYIRINMDNIKPEYEHNFVKNEKTKFSDFGTRYDYYSIMHYNSYAAAIDPSKPVIETIDPQFNSIIGNVKEASDDDYRRINRMYNCKDVILS